MGKKKTKNDFEEDMEIFMSSKRAKKLIKKISVEHNMSKSVAKRFVEMVYIATIEV